MRNCVLVRHWITKGNTEKRYTGRSDEHILPADPQVVSSVRDGITSHLNGDFCVITGPMIRCHETASALFPEHDTKTIEELTEIDFGLFEGKTHEELEDVPEYVAWLNGGWRAAIPGGERLDDFKRRSMEGFTKALEISCGRDCVIVCHGGNIMSVMSTLTKGEYYDFRPDNLEGYALSVEEDGRTICVVSYDRVGCGDRN